MSHTKRIAFRARLYDLLARLDPQRFLRIHRSHVVNLDFITAIEPRNGSRLTVVLASGTRIPVSRSGSAALRPRAGKLRR